MHLTAGRYVVRAPASLWLGLVQRGDQLSPWWRRDWLRYDRAGRAVPFDLERLRPGQCVVPMRGAFLTGVLLPLEACADPLARAQLEALAGARGLGLEARCERLQRVGPFGRVRNADRWRSERVLELDCTPALYRWLALRFRMAVALEPVLRTAPLPGDSLSAFAAWLGGEAPLLPVPAIQRFLSAALVGA